MTGLTNLTKVLLVDDQPLLRLGFRMILENEPDLEVVGEASDGARAAAMTAALAPDVVLMDVRMPAVDGIEGTRRIVGSGSAARILVLTTFNLDEYVYAALRAGASGFLLKDAPRAELVNAVRVVAAGDALLAPAVTARVLGELYRRGNPDPALAAAISTLTARETDVLRLIAAGLSNSEIAARRRLSEHTVKTHVGNLFAKLALRDRAQAVMVAYESGLVVPGA